MATSAPPAAAAPISGRLARSRSPPAPKTAITPPFGDLAGRAQRVLERVGGVRVVDDDREGLALLDGLEAPRHATGTRQRVGDRRVVDAELAGDDDRRERVADVEAPRQRGPQLEVVDREARAARVGAQDPRAHLCVGGVEADRGSRSGSSPGQARAVGVVDVDHGQLGPGLEEPALGEEVVLHVGVEVEVVLGEVGEDGHRPVDGVGAVQGERVARDLHDDGLVPGGEHVGEGPLQVDRLGGGARDGVLPGHPTMAVTVPSRPVERPPASSSARTRKAVVVLPLVPVIPTVVRRAVGSPASAAAAGAIAARTSSTRISGTPRCSGRCTTSATAPRAIASSAKSWPSRVKPGTQKNSVPGVTSRLS